MKLSPIDLLKHIKSASIWRVNATLEAKNSYVDVCLYAPSHYALESGNGLFRNSMKEVERLSS
jgi:hypothetical protein